MNPLNLIKKFISQIKDYFRSETELIRLKLIRMTAIIAANLFAAVFVITMLNITLAILGIWFGFFLSGLLHSYAVGFGLSGLTYLLILILIIVFRKTLLIRPFTNIGIIILQELNFNDEDQESEGA